MKAAVLGVLVLAAAAPVLAQTETRGITGRVVAAEDGAALPRVRVVAEYGGSPSRSETVLTDADGRFGLAGTAPGRIVLRFTKAGYAAVQLVTAGPAGAAATPLEVPMPKGAAVVGRVVNQSGEPVVRARVTARPEAGISNELPQGADTDERGEYRIWGLRPGRYLVGVVAPMTQLLQNGVRVDVMTTSGLDAQLVSQAVDVRAGDEVRTADMLVQRTMSFPVAAAGAAEESQIVGRIVGEHGEPIAAVSVRFMRDAAPVRSAFTDADGRYVSGRLGPGDYRVEAVGEGYVVASFGQLQATDPGETVAVTNDSRATVDIALSRGSAVSGRVTDEAGEPLEGVTVEVLVLRSTGGRLVASGGRVVSTDDRGEYRAWGLLPGTYIVAASINAAVADGEGFAPVYYPSTTRIDEAVPVTVERGENIGVNVVAAPARLARVTGRVTTASGVPIAGTVQLSLRAAASSISRTPRVATIGSDGHYVITDVPSGDYMVHASGTQGPGSSTEFGVTTVLVADGDPAPADIRTSRGVTIEGRFIVELHAGASEAASRLPFNLLSQGLSLRAIPLDPDSGVVTPAIAGAIPPGATVIAPTPDSRGRAAAMSSKGTFYITGLYGPMRLVTSGLPPDVYVKAVRVAGDDAADAVVDFGREERTIDGVEVVLASNSASVSGMVSDGRNAPAASPVVVVFPTAQDRWLPGARQLKATRAARGGAFRITGLPPGDYWVAAVDRLDGLGTDAWQRGDVLDPLVSRARRLTLAEGESATVNLSPR